MEGNKDCLKTFIIIWFEVIIRSRLGYIRILRCGLRIHGHSSASKDLSKGRLRAMLANQTRKNFRITVIKKKTVELKEIKRATIVKYSNLKLLQSINTSMGIQECRTGNLI